MIPLMIGAALSIGSAVAKHQGEQANADAQEAANARRKRMAVTEFNHTQQAVIEQERQDIEATTEAKIDNHIKALQTKATALTAAGEGGVAGTSIKRMVGEVMRQEGRNEVKMDTSLQNRQSQRNREIQSSYREMLNTFESMPPVQRPSSMGAIMEAGQGIMSSYATFGAG